MARGRGFLAELQRQSQAAARRAEQDRRAAHRAQVAAARNLEQARRASERAAAQLSRATEAERKAAEREAKRLHEEEMLAEVAGRNARLAEQYDEIDTLLSWTLHVDDFVDLESFHQVAQHPPFPRPDLEQQQPPPIPLQAPPEPFYVEPPKPSGLKSVFGGKEHAERVAAAQAEYHRQHDWWRHQVAELPGVQLRQMQEHQAREQQRLAALDDARRLYQHECAQRDAQVAEANAKIDALIAGLAVGDEAAVHEYLWIVLGKSMYPDSFPVDHDFEFDASLRELDLAVRVPPPESLPTVKEYKYVKARDEITHTDLAQKALKDRYASAVAQVALRTLHEVFEADRAGCVQTISLTVGAETIDPATGLPLKVPFVAVAADRSFASFDLSNVIPVATLEHLGAQVSKNPFGLVPVDLSKGVRSK